MADPDQWKCPWCGWGRLVPVLGTYRDHSACVDGLAAKAIARTLERDQARSEAHDDLRLRDEENDALRFRLAAHVPCRACGWAKTEGPASGEEIPIIKGALDAQAEIEGRMFALEAKAARQKRAIALLSDPNVLAEDEDGNPLAIQCPFCKEIANESPMAFLHPDECRVVQARKILSGTED